MVDFSPQNQSTGGNKFLNEDAKEYFHKYKQIRDTYQPPNIVASNDRAYGTTTMHCYMETLQ